MAGGPGSYVYRMGFGAEGICVWGRTEKVCRACWVAWRGKRGGGISDELFGFAGELVPARCDCQGQSFANHRDRGIDDGPRRCRECISPAYFWIRGYVAR